MNTSVVTFLVLATVMMIGISTVTAQTFQYSRGWTNGKRNGISPNGVYEFNLIEKLLSNPCQLEKLRYIIQGKPFNEKLMVPCELLGMNTADADSEAPAMRLKRSASPFENRQNLV